MFSCIHCCVHMTAVKKIDGITGGRILRYPICLIIWVPIQREYAGGTICDSSCKVTSQSTPMARFCSVSGIRYTPTSTVLRRFVRLVACGNLGVCQLWLQPGDTIGKLLSKRRWRLTSSPNAEPHSTIGFIKGAPGTFSITYGSPVAIRASRVTGIRLSAGATWSGRRR
jgi:hypothetical protein